MIRNMVLVNFIGLMEDVIKDFGEMADRMGLEYIEVVMELKERVNGKMGRNFVGLMNEYKN